MLLLPDFIREKYPQWEKLSHGTSDEVQLFPTWNISQGEELQVRTLPPPESLDLPPLEEFSRIYIAGAHFYFSLYVISRGRPFSFFEDAAGMLSRPEEAANILAAKFPGTRPLPSPTDCFPGTTL